MTILRAVLAELGKMFLADARISAALVTVVAIAAVVHHLAPGFAAGGLLLAGALAVLVGGVLGARRS